MNARRTQEEPLHMESFFKPGFVTRPAVHIGSQTSRLYLNDPLEQAVEGLHLAAALQGDLVVVRNMDPDYIAYWQNLVEKTEIINIQHEDTSTFLSTLILSDTALLDQIKGTLPKNAQMMVYFPTRLEQELAEKIGAQLHGSPVHSTMFGTKSGIRELAKKYALSMPEGYACNAKECVAKKIRILFDRFSKIVIKHDISSAGRWIVTLNKGEDYDINKLLNNAAGGTFREGTDTVVVEGWIQSKASLCAHIEIAKGKKPRIAAAWQQVIGADGISYEGAGPLTISQTAFKSFMKETRKLANALYEEKAYGSFGPDYVITSEDEQQTKPDTAVLIELNARVPFTAFPLEIVRHVRGTIGSGFLSHKIVLSKKMTFREVKEKLVEHNLLIEKPGTKSGVVPFNVNLLRWKELYYVAIGKDWNQTQNVVKKVKKLF